MLAIIIIEIFFVILQIYSLDAHHHGPDLYLSGTAEMSLAGLLRDTVHPKCKLPIRLAAVSRCYRAETSNVVEERGVYRYVDFNLKYFRSHALFMFIFNDTTLKNYSIISYTYIKKSNNVFVYS